MLTGKELQKVIESFLLSVKMPGQYIGGEWNSISKSADSVQTRLALCFPDTYSIGMSNHGLRTLYEIVNSISGVSAERSFVPLPDMQHELRQRKLPLYTLESFTPLGHCDLVGFSLQYELCCTNVLSMLDLAGIPLISSERQDSDPLVIAGGAGSFNPEPYADFIDLFLVGDGEEALPELLLAYQKMQQEKLPRKTLIHKLASQCQGWYAPSLYSEGSYVESLTQGIPPQIKRRIVKDLNLAPHPQRPVIPVVQTVHERITLEIMRGCPNGCRFCQAGMVGRPTRVRSQDTILQLAESGYATSGYDEIGLLSLSTSDYPYFDSCLEKLHQVFSCRGVNISLPSLRVDSALGEIPRKVAAVRRGSFTIAPEAGTERLRAIINKDVTDENLYQGAEAAYAAGWRSIKLYFMIGLPGEKEEDILAIPRLAMKVAKLRRKKGGGTPVTLSVSNFVPKAHTPLQWARMNNREELKDKQKLIVKEINHKLVSCKMHTIDNSLIEAMIARGDRNIGKIILAAWKRGAQLDAWSEYFKMSAWEQAFSDCQVKEEDVCCASYSPGQKLPWSYIDTGITAEFLLSQWQQAKTGKQSSACSQDSCAGCGVEGCSFSPNHLD